MPRKKKEANVAISKSAKKQDEVIVLPTAEEYNKDDAVHDPMIRDYCEPKYQCSKCDGAMCRNAMHTLLSQRPLYRYKCNKCGHIEHLRY